MSSVRYSVSPDRHQIQRIDTARGGVDDLLHRVERRPEQDASSRDWWNTRIGGADVAASSVIGCQVEDRVHPADGFGGDFGIAEITGSSPPGRRSPAGCCSTPLDRCIHHGPMPERATRRHRHPITCAPVTSHSSTTMDTPRFLPISFVDARSVGQPTHRRHVSVKLWPLVAAAAGGDFDHRLNEAVGHDGGIMSESIVKLVARMVPTAAVARTPMSYGQRRRGGGRADPCSAERDYGQALDAAAPNTRGARQVRRRPAGGERPAGQSCPARTAPPRGVRGCPQC